MNGFKIFGLITLTLLRGFNGLSNITIENSDDTGKGYFTAAKMDSVLLVNKTEKEIRFLYYDMFDDRISLFLKPLSTYKIYTNGPVFLIQINRYQNFYVVYPREKIYVALNAQDNAILTTKNNIVRDNELDFSRNRNEKTNMPFLKMNQYRAKYIKEDYFKVDSLYKKEYEDNLLFLSDYKLKRPISDKYEEIIRSYFLSHLYGVQLFFIGIEQRDRISPQYKKYLLSLEDKIITNPLYKNDSWFNKLQYTYLRYKFPEKNLGSSDSIYLIVKRNLTDADKLRLCFWIVKAALKKNQDANEWIVRDFLSENTNADYKYEIEAMIADQKVLTDLNMEVSIIDSQRKKINLDSVLNEFKGSIIYIDFWASWCIPCRKEMQPSKRLRIHYSKEKIKFVYVSIDKSITAWRKASEQEAIQNFQYNYWLPDFQNSKISKLLKLESIPRYILINKEGKIVNADAPRPSNPELEMILDKLIAG